MRRRRHAPHRAIKLCVLALVVIGVLLIVGRTISRGATERIVLQVGNHMALHNDEVLPITGDTDEGLEVYAEKDDVMVPAEWLANAMALTVSHNQADDTIIFTNSENEKQQAQLQVGKLEMVEDSATATLTSAPIDKEGVLYVPAQALCAAFDWNMNTVDETVFIDNAKKSKMVTEEQKKSAKQLLGPSRSDLLTGGLIGRTGSGTLLWSGARVELQTEEKKYQGVIEQDGVRYLPIESTLKALGGSAESNGEGYKVTLGEISVAVENSEEAKAYLYQDEDEITYLSAEKLADILKLQYTEVSDSGFALTVDKLSGYASQESYIASVSAELPDKKLSIPDAKGYIALTFDDGPTGGTDGLTVRLLNGLKERGAHATFFMCGYRVKDFHTHMERYLEEGHELANHTMDHPLKFSRISPEEIYSQVDSNSELIASYTKQRPTAMRPVGGAVSANVQEQMKKLNLPIINWSVDTLDWKYRDANRIKNVIINQAKDGDIVLMHDLHQPTVDGVLAAIDELKKQDYAFVTVHELAQIKGVVLEPGEVYTRIE